MVVYNSVKGENQMCNALPDREMCVDVGSCLG